jgi:elongation factor Ts
MKISSKDIKELREKTGAGIMDVKKALQESQGDFNKAIEVLKKKGAEVAKKKSSRETKEGLIETYIHAGGKIGVVLELNCETDFVARNSEFKELAHDLAMNIAALNPQFIKSEDLDSKEKAKQIEIFKAQLEKENKPAAIKEKIIEGRIKKYAEEQALLSQPYIKDQKRIIQDLVNEKIGKIGENIQIGGFARFDLNTNSKTFFHYE